MRIRHSSHDFATSSSHSVDLAGWQAKMASIEFGYLDVMRTSPVNRKSLQNSVQIHGAEVFNRAVFWLALALPRRQLFFFFQLSFCSLSLKARFWSNSELRFRLG